MAIPIDRWFWLAPVLLGAVALAVRLPDLDHIAHFDELYHFLAARGWLAEGQLRVADGTYDRTALFTIFLAQWLGLFGDNLVVARLPSLIAGTALVVLVFLWTRAVAGRLAAILAALLLAFDPEAVEISQFARFYALHSLLFWLGAIGIFRLVTAPPSPARAILLAAGTAICFAAALYLQITTLIGLLGVALWAVLALAVPWLASSSPRLRWAAAGVVALLGVAGVGIAMAAGLTTKLLDLYRDTPLYLAERRNAFWFYHSFLTIYYPTLWPLVALAVVIGLASRPRPTAFCACVVGVAFLVHSFAASKEMRYFAYAQPFLFVIWGIGVAEVWPRLWRFLEDVGARALSSLGLDRLGRSGVFAALALVLVFTLAANGAFVRTAAPMFDVTIPPMQRPADWATAKEPLASWLADADIVLTTSELEALYYLGRYDVLISKSRLSELNGAGEFSVDPRTGRPVIGKSESLALIMDCYPNGLIVSSAGRWRNPAQLDDAVANLIVANTEEVEVPAFEMQAYVWQQPNDAHRTQACAGLPAELGKQHHGRRVMTTSPDGT